MSNAAWRSIALGAAALAWACESDPPTTPPEVARLTLWYSSRVVTVNQQVTMRAIAYTAEDQRMNSPPVEWTSDDPFIATVAANGIITGHGVGPVVIRATTGEVQASVEIVVRPARVRIRLASGSDDLRVGEKAVLIAEYLDANGHVVPGNEAVRWSGFNGGVVAVDSTAGDSMQREFTARSIGLAGISAFAVGVEGRYVLAVISPAQGNPPVEIKSFRIAQFWGEWDDLVMEPSLRVAVSPGHSVELVKMEVALAGQGPRYLPLCSNTRLLAGDHTLLGSGSYPSAGDMVLHWYEAPVIPRGVALLTYREGGLQSTVAVRESVNPGISGPPENVGLRWEYCEPGP